MKPWSLLAVIGVGAVAAACGTEVPGAGPSNLNRGGTTTCVAGTPTACACQPGTTYGQACDAQGQLYQCGCTPSTVGPDGSGGTHPLPCDVAAVVQQACWTCHGATRQFTAPMSLVTYEDFQAPAPSNPARKVYEVVAERVHHETMPMPPPPNARLDASQLALMDAWLSGGAIAGTQATCGTTVDPVAGAGGAGGTGGVGGTGGAGGAPAPGNVQCFEFRAHAQGDVNAGYPVGAGTKDAYMNFTFNAAWPAGAQAISFKSKIDNTNVIHHWLLYQSDGSVPEGGVESSSGTHGGDELLAGWAPGASDNVLPDDVGMRLGTGFTLELHYNNAGAVTETDHSGVEVCVTDTPRTHEAGLHWLGTEAIFLAGAGNAAGNCTPRQDLGPITILRSWPHMHLKGTHLSTLIKRTGGAAPEMLIDKPFDFHNQVAYDTPAVINPGDTLTTTCTYNAGATFGPGTTAEMCYNFVLAYPNGALTSTNPLGGGLTSTVNHCFQ
jgi:hypothetical protein